MTGTIADISARFAVAGALLGVEPQRGGHIHDSYLLSYEESGGTKRYLLQRINNVVFPEPDKVMENIGRVTEHIRGALSRNGVADIDRRTLALIPTVSGESWWHDEDGDWRMYRFIEGVETFETAQDADQAYQAGAAFGCFQRLLADFPPPRLHDTIPDFHDTPRRYEALEQAIRTDRCGRVAGVHDEITLARSHRSWAGMLMEGRHRGELPERVVHNDAKISNVLFEAAGGKALCVVDLDLVMPGVAPFDFGDMVRSMTSSGAEDEADLSKVDFQWPLFEGLARGYMDEARAFLTEAERIHLVLAGKLITLEQGVRFLTDFLDDDRYYRTERPEHNLDRCRTQFRLVELMSNHEQEMNHLVDSL
jgi:hypothetical protein